MVGHRLGCRTGMKPRALIDTRSRSSGKHEICGPVRASLKSWTPPCVDGKSGTRGMGQTRRLAMPVRCESGRTVQRAPLSLAYRSKEDSRLPNTCLFGAVRSEQTFYCNRRSPPTPSLSAGPEGIGVLRHARRRCAAQDPAGYGARCCTRLDVPEALGVSNRSVVFNRACRPSCVPSGSSAATPALRS